MKFGILRHALNYNERKVKEQVATCLGAVNYPKDVEDLTFYQKLNRLQNQADQNIKTKVNSVHISLNFDPSKKLFEEKLKEIFDTYLQKIGFGNQPYLSPCAHCDNVSDNVNVKLKIVTYYKMNLLRLAPFYSSFHFSYSKQVSLLMRRGG